VSAHVQPWAGRAERLCTSCGTELAPNALACPACHVLVHAAALKDLAAQAESSAQANRLGEARETWQRSLELLPPTSQQHAAVRSRIADLDRRIAAQPSVAKGGAATSHQPWWKRGAAAGVGVLVLLLGKLKFLILGLTKASTFLSMFAFLGVYWSLYGWPLALGFVVSIYIHEMGHVAMLKKLGIDAGAPLFVPGVGALVLLKQRIEDPNTDAAIGLAGPVWGFGAGLAAYAVYKVTAVPVWAAIAQLTGFINLFNMIPVWQLDGSRGFHALSTPQRWGVVIALVAAFLLTHQKMLIIVGAVALFRVFQRTTVPGSHRAFATFVLLIAGLAWLSGVHQV
jgi:Zn-dependent protease